MATTREDMRVSVEDAGMAMGSRLHGYEELDNRIDKELRELAGETHDRPPTTTSHPHPQVQELSRLSSKLGSNSCQAFTPFNDPRMRHDPLRSEIQDLQSFETSSSRKGDVGLTLFKDFAQINFAARDCLSLRFMD